MPTRKEFQVHSLAAAKKRAQQKRAQATPVVIALPSKRLAHEVFRMANGDLSRVQFLSTDTAVVWNSQAQKLRLARKVR